MAEADPTRASANKSAAANFICVDCEGTGTVDKCQTFDKQVAHTGSSTRFVRKRLRTNAIIKADVDYRHVKRFKSLLHAL